MTLPVEQTMYEHLPEGAFGPDDHLALDTAVAVASRVLTGSACSAKWPALSQVSPDHRTSERIRQLRGVLAAVTAAVAETAAVLDIVDRAARDRLPGPGWETPEPVRCRLLTDQLGWTKHDDGTVGRLVVLDTAVWHITWNGHLLAHNDLHGSGASSAPATVWVGSEELPDTAPALLTGALSACGAVMIVPNPDLWDAITAAVLGWGLERPRARALYRRWTRALGPTYTTPAGPVAAVPDVDTVLHLPREAFAAAGVVSRVRVARLQAAAAAYRQHADTWAGMPTAKLAGALRGVRGLGPALAAVIAAHARGDYSMYPTADPAVRAGIAAVSTELHVPRDTASFNATWRRWAAEPPQVHALTVYALAHTPYLRPTPAPRARRGVRAQH